MAIKLKKLKKQDELEWTDFKVGDVVLVTTSASEKKYPPYLADVIVMRTDGKEYPLVVIQGNQHWRTGEQVSKDSAENYWYLMIEKGSEFIIS